MLKRLFLCGPSGGDIFYWPPSVVYISLYVERVKYFLYLATTTLESHNTNMATFVLLSSVLDTPQAVLHLFE